MEFYRKIKNLSDEELESLVEKIIGELEENSIEDNPGVDTIGFVLDYNPKEFYILEKEEIKSFKVDFKCFYSGYVRKGMKMSYGLVYSGDGVVSNDGRYYYIDDDSYILDFCKYIRDKEVENEYELFGYVLNFIEKYLGYIEEINREDMFKMIYKSDRIKYDPVYEHTFSQFKGRGNGVCSEKTIMANNILNVFDMYSYIMIGREKNTDDDKGESHAFNIVTYEEETTKELKNLLIDFSGFIRVRDINFNVLERLPFIGELDELTEEMIINVIESKEHLIFEDYDYMVIANSLFKIGYSRDRDYYIEERLVPDEKLKTKKY